MNLSESAQEFYAVFDNCDASSLHEASKSFAKFHGYSYSKNKLCIDNTSQTVMKNMLAKTQNTPDDELDIMRKKRQTALEEFVYIYGGYIAWELKKRWEKAGYREINEQNEFISLGAEQVLNCIIKKLEKDGYKEGTFSHLVNKSIKFKMSDVGKRYKNWSQKEHNTPCISFEEAKDIVGGIIEIADDSDVNDFDSDFDFDEKKLHKVGIENFLKKVRVTKNHEDDFEMLCRLRANKEKAEDIARDMGLSVATVYNRVKDFAAAAWIQYKKYLKEMEKC